MPAAFGIAFAEALRGINRVLSPSRPGRMVLGLSGVRSMDRIPPGFKTYRDPQGRFRLSYPGNWKLHRSGAVHVVSEQIGSFARVDPFRGSREVWDEIQESFRQAGGKVKIESRRGTDPEVVKGWIKMDGRRFDWEARAYSIPTGTLVLSLGNVVDKRRGRAIERYEDGVLRAIRRHFKVTAGRNKAE